MNINQANALQPKTLPAGDPHPVQPQGQLAVQGRHLPVQIDHTPNHSTTPFFTAAKNFLLCRTELTGKADESTSMSYQDKYEVVKNQFEHPIPAKTEKMTEAQKALIDKHFDAAARIYLDRRESFAMKHADLKLGARYHSELPEPHFYPNSNKTVRYMQDASAQKVTLNHGHLPQITNLDGTNVAPGKAKKAIIFVRSNSLSSIQNQQTYATPKMSTVEDNVRKRTQHSSFKQGGNVVSAGKLIFNKQNELKTVIAHSGHYHPTIESMYKFAEFGKQTGQFDPDKIIWKDHDEHKLPMNQANRMKAVLDWAEQHPKSSDSE
ncbi:hypothetical protein [Vibrio mangrovi]|uniref:Uncharacterized protein n=1 Tax=Vibrio mangrovi TaxID=474394 RepID=A0A1Y6IY35_9VIBR|nr:hypothetical protein [Vibrio mangrovi]MDW6005223.1 hypothetical protein [Vibrio mangrovi]SMS02567.1 hypothetical protein VIM7927_03900 [Vibrio mangrovi]